ncbi:Eco57I restriction-modification methylase domain-containing protein [Gordonia sp. DT218]|uniref:Eco57I restriction-modification methylase domain-containing protein n=1 Tax=Gordonia sp. DT218 TaxID=3416659 RepID=UPI003CE98920
MFDSIQNVNDFLSEHWLAEVFPAKLKEHSRRWKELADQDKKTPLRGLSSISGRYLTALGDLPSPVSADYVGRVTDLHVELLAAVGFEAVPTVLETTQAETAIAVPLLGRFASATSTDSLHILQAVPVDSTDALFGGDAALIDPLRVHITREKTDSVDSVTDAITQLFVTDDPPRYLLVIAGSALLLTDVARWAEGRYLAFDVATALDRRDEKAVGELAYHAGLWSSDALLPDEDGKTELDHYTEDSEKHAVGVSEDLREGLRISIEKIANEVLTRRREAGLSVDGIPELPRDLTTQSLRFLYRILFLLFAEARPELGVLPVGTPEYESGYGLDRLRELVQVPLTGRSADGHHLHESLDRLFRLVNTGHNPGREDTEAMVFEPLRSDLFDPQKTPLIDGEGMRLSNRVLQEVLNLLLLSKPSKRKNRQRGYISYAQLGINQLGAVYEGLMSYSGLIASEDVVEVAKDGNADKGSWLVPSTRSHEYDEKDIVWREDRLTGRKDIVRHAKGSFVFRLSGRDRQRSASYYTPEVLTKCVVKHALAELITDETTAADILQYRICEPALGSGAFLNEAINQLAAEYLSRRQDELKERIQPEEYTTELQKVKAYLALHRAYGVDLNSTAVELAEVSLWLNVMHSGLQAPWFGLHLRRGNSLIGARRATYDFTSLGRAKKSWLKTPPTDRPLHEGAIGDGEIHHFLLPADGWAAVADAKQAKELAPDEASALREWRKSVTKKPSAKQLDRLRALATRVERLWALVLRRLEISEQQISRQIDVWGADLPTVDSAVDRVRVEEELHDPEGPYERLRLAMDAWCALWFWPLTGSVEDTDDGHPGPPDLDEWIVTLEELLGAAGVKKVDKAQGSFQDLAEGFDELALIDDKDREFSGMRSVPDLLVRHQWLGTARTIAQEQGVFHWELDFASVFKRGGFDLQVGNPPWVRIEWNEYDVLAEERPELALVTSKTVARERYARIREDYFGDDSSLVSFIEQFAAHQGVANFLTSEHRFPYITKLPLNLYRNFIIVCWSLAAPSGVTGLLHPDDHFFHDKAGLLRANCYRRLRRHWGFVNELMLFPEISDTSTYGIHIYGSTQEISFMQAAKLYHPMTVDGSLLHDGSGPTPGLQRLPSGWDLTPHLKRIIRVNSSTIDDWSRLFEELGTPPLQAKMPAATSVEQEEALELLSRLPRMSEKYVWSRCWDEDKIKSLGVAQWETARPMMLNDLVLQPPHFGALNLFSKQPIEHSKGSSDYVKVDPELVGEHFVPRSNYRYLLSERKRSGLIRRWFDTPVTEFWRLAWRRRLGQNMERTLQVALIPPGVAHVDTVHTCTVSTCATPVHTIEDLPRRPEEARNTAIVAGLWASLPYDYLVKLTGTGDLRAPMVDRFPLVVKHAATNSLLLRTLRLNCVTDDYAPLWDSLYECGFASDQWTSPLTSLLGPLSIDEETWTTETPLRTDFERRAALVEIDALSALMLGLTAEHLALMFRAQFPVLRKYEYEMYFDANGRKIAKDHHAQGVRQQKDDYKLLQAWMIGEDCGDLLDRYTPFAPDADHDEPWFYKPDREAEMRAAYADFEQRLADA